MLNLGSNFKLREEDDGAFVCNQETQQIFVANKSATEIYQFAINGATRENIFTMLSQLYPRDEIQGEINSINEFLDKSINEGFLIQSCIKVG